MTRASLARCVAGLVLGLACGLAGAETPRFSPEELARIVALGPWPMPVVRDPSNRASGQPAAIELGRQLFFDSRLSPIGYIGCVTCHQPDRAWTDGRARGHGLADVDRNTQALFNLRLQRWYGWGGTADSLWLASIRPMLDERELDSNPRHIVQVYRRDEELACRYRQVFGVFPYGQKSDTVLVNTGKALAAFVETLGSERTPFDEFRDAVARQDPAAQEQYPAAAQRGLQTFVGRGNCFMCHAGPNFSNGEFHNVGVRHFIAPARADGGRFDGIETVTVNRFNLLSRFNDDATGANTEALRHVVLDPRNWGEFRTPSLRNVAVTAPYMHNGSVATLRDAVLHYSKLDEERLHADGEKILRPLNLSEDEIADLVAFLETLSDRHGADRPRPAVAPPCPPQPPRR
jgi:cytochrome c peroxidase